MDVSQYLTIFLDETKEHLQALNEQLLVLEKEPDNEETISEIFRAAHSLKGMAGTMGYKNMQHLTHEWESLFMEVRDGKITIKPEMVDVLFRGLDCLEKYLENIQTTNDEGETEAEAVIADLHKFTDAEDAAPAKTVAAAAPSAAPAAGSFVFKSANLEEHELNALKQAKEEGRLVIGATVYIRETCMLKSARAFLVFKALD
jgi:two-component system chemotaxis sensor kinase CheA